MTHKTLRGIVPPLPTPMELDGRQVDVDALVDLVNLHLNSGVHALWVLGTTARFDLLTDAAQRVVAETVARQAAGKVPLILNISDQGTLRTLTRARLFNDLPYDFYAALPPWYLPMTSAEVRDYFLSLADGLSRPLFIYNAPWVCNQLSFDHLQRLAEHPRIVGCKDVTPLIGRGELWSAEARQQLGFTYLHGSDQIALSTALGSDGFVSALSDIVPELAVALWNAVHSGAHARALELQIQFSRLAHATTLGPFLACLNAMGHARGLFQSMLPHPLQALDPTTHDRVIAILRSVDLADLPKPKSSKPARV